MKIKENSFNVGIKACLAFNTCSIFSSQASESVLIAEHINLYDWKFYAFIPCFKRYATQVYDILFSCQFCFRSIFFTTTGCMQAVAPIQIINNFAVIVTLMTYYTELNLTEEQLQSLPIVRRKNSNHSTDIRDLINCASW